jgi:hypothetical protein
MQLFPESVHDRVKKVLDPGNTLVMVTDDLEEGTESKVIVRSSSGGEEEVVLLSDLLPLFVGEEDDTDGSNQKKWNRLLSALFEYEKCTYAYFSSGAARGAEVGEDMRGFDTFSFSHNTLRFGLVSNKNSAHGVKRGGVVYHHTPPTLSRKIVLLHLCIKKHLSARSDLEWPSESTAAAAASKCFAKVMQLSPSLKIGPKLCRDLIVQVVNCQFPQLSSSAKFTTWKDFSDLFHHSPDVHATSYGGTHFTRDETGEIIQHPLIIAAMLWEAMGEREQVIGDASFATPQSVNTVSHTDLLRGLKFIMQSPSASFNPGQFEVIQAVDSGDNLNSIIVKGSCGCGKSLNYLVPPAARKLAGAELNKTLVVSPHAPLVAQNEVEASKHFRGLGVRVHSVSTSQAVEGEFDFDGNDFDVLFISIHAFSILRANHSSILQMWGATRIIVDEFHLAIAELFRFESSWKSLESLSVLNAKIIAQSATQSVWVRRMFAEFAKLGDYRFIGSDKFYRLPDIAIKVVKASEYMAVPLAVRQVKERHSKCPPGSKPATHLLVTSKEAAKQLSNRLQAEGLTSGWITSEASAGEKKDTVSEWSTQQIETLSSTYTDGLNNSACDGVVLLGGTYSTVSAIQGSQRQRPAKQTASTVPNSSLVTFFLTPSGTREDPDEMNAKLQKLEDFQLIPEDWSEDEKQEAKEDFARLFGKEQLRRSLNGEECYRKALFRTIEVGSGDCRVCDWCTKHCPTRINAESSLAAIASKEERKQFVLSRINELTVRCFVCHRPDCKGDLCASWDWEACFKCHGQKHSSGWEECSAKFVPQMGKGCSKCLILNDDRLPGGGEECPCKTANRVRRILLWDYWKRCKDNQDFRHNFSIDKGRMAKNRLVDCFLDGDVWFNTMYKNMKGIEAERNYAN